MTDQGVVRARWIFVAVLLIGAWFRLADLGRSSFMIDEINVVQAAVSAESFGSIIDTELERFHWYHRLPFLMMILRAFALLAGYQNELPPEWIMRLPFAFLGIATLGVAYLFGKFLRDRIFGLMFMALLAASTFHIYYSREAYDYSLIIFASMVSLLTGIQLLQRWKSDLSVPWKHGAVFAASGILLLQSHLSGLLFLAPWTGLLFLSAFLHDRKIFCKPVHAGSWILWGSIPFVIFIPFLTRLIGQGFKVTEAEYANRASWQIIPNIIGRMGVGEWWLPILLFSALMIAGVVSLLKSPQQRWIGILVLGQLLGYIAIQTWALRVSRFEIRYYAAMYPILWLVMAWGCYSVGEMLKTKSKRSVGLWLPAVVIILLSLPSAFQVTQIQCRGYNFKHLAQWITDHVPEKGVYAFLNVYDLRGVPHVYPTPNRFGTHVVSFSSRDDYLKVRARDRWRDFYTRFPLAYFIEFVPLDIYGAENAIEEERLPREDVFSQRIVLEDKAFQKLVKWKTWPQGTAQWNSPYVDRIHIGWNTEEDLIERARRENRPVINYFGPEWSYTKDQRLNDWKVLSGIGTLVFQNVIEQPVKGRIQFAWISNPENVRVNIYGAGGSRIASGLQIKAGNPHFTTQEIILNPGETTITVEALPPVNHERGYLLVYGVGFIPSSASESVQEL